MSAQNSIRIVRGPLPSTLGYCLDLAKRDDNALWLPHQRACHVSWMGFRTLIAQLIAKDGRDRLEAVARRHRTAAGLLISDELAQPADSSDPRQVSERDGIAAKIDSHLSHNWAVQRPLYDAAAVLLQDLLEGRPCTLVAPSLDYFDIETLSLIRSLYRQFGVRAPSIVAGHDPDLEPSIPNEEGLLWRRGASTGIQIAAGLLSVSRLPPIELSRQPKPEPDAAAITTGGLDRASAGPFEDSARLRLRDSRRDLSPSDCRLVVAAMWASFRRFGFASALSLGLDLLEREPTLTPPQLADVHALIGLSAHNRQFHTMGNTRLARFLETHLASALEHETRPAERCATLYRLAVTRGRRLGELDAALETCDQAVEETRDRNIPPLNRARLESWARNIRSYVLMRLHRLDESSRDLERAFEILSAARAEAGETPASSGEGWTQEMSSTLSLAAGNRATLAAISGDVPLAAHWRRKCTESVEGLEGEEVFDAASWVDLLRGTHRPREALRKALSGLESAERELDMASAYRYRVSAADLCYRIGDALGSVEHYRLAEETRLRFGVRDFLLPVELASVGASIRSGRDEDARGILESQLDNGLTPEARAEVQATLAALSARTGDGDRAEIEIDRAIETAVASGARDTLLRVATAAGEVALRLGRREDAEAAFRQALEIGEESENEKDSSPPPRGDSLRATLSLQECTGVDPDLIRRGLEILPAALGDADAWWDLPRMLELLSAAAEGYPRHFDQLRQDGLLAILSRAAEQREDCRAGLERLESLTSDTPSSAVV